MNFINFVYSIFNKKLFKYDTLPSSGLFFNDLNFFHFELYFILSLITLLVFFVILSNKKNYRSHYYLSVANIITNLLPFVIILLLIILNNNTIDSYYLFAGFYYNDAAVVFFKNVILLAFFIFIFAIRQYIAYFRYYDFEFILLLFTSLFSSILMLNSSDLVSLFFIIELQGLTFYVLVASKQTSSFSTESGLKYFILGCFSSGIILFGISLIYGFTGLLSYTDLALFLSEVELADDSTLNSNFLSFSGFIVGFLLLTVGFLFKLGSVPFHMWMPDVYEGSPLLITAYLSTLPKISLIFVIFKLYYYVFFEIFLFCQGLFTLTALLSIALGSVAAIYQIKLKRMLTYSMITNTGYLLLGLSFGDISGIYVTLFYLLSYIFIMIGLFFCFLSLRERSSGLLAKRINIFSNLLEINPFLSLSIFILLFSIAGVPPLLGFYSKFFLFLFSLKYKMYWLTILFVFFSVISVFYYIRLVKLMYFNRSSDWVFFYDISFSNSLIISFITFINFLFFLNPNLLFKFLYNFSFYFYV